MLSPCMSDWAKVRKLGEILAEAHQTGAVVRMAGCPVQPPGVRRHRLRWMPAHAQVNQRRPGQAQETWATTQTVSSGEPEYYGVVKGMCEALGIKGIAKDMGLDLSIILSTDSSAAKGIATGKGLGEGQTSVDQDAVAWDKIDEGRVVAKKIGGDRNFADILTTYFFEPEATLTLGRTPSRRVGEEALIGPTAAG